MPKRKDTNKFKEEVYSLVGDEYTVLGEYTEATNKILLRHNNCLDGDTYEYETTPSSFLKGSRCPHCSRMKIILANKKTTKEFLGYLFVSYSHKGRDKKNYFNTVNLKTGEKKYCLQKM